MVKQFYLTLFYGTLSGTTTPGQSRPGINGNVGVLRVPQRSRTEASPSDGLVSYPGHSLGKSSQQRCSLRILQSFLLLEYPRGVMVKAMDCGIVVSEFVLQSCYYVHFRANTLGKGMNPLILPAMC